MTRLPLMVRAALICFIFLSCSALADTEYRLGSGDLISIVVFGEEDLSIEVRINDQATISYPFLGKIVVLDKAVDELEADIVSGLRGDYLIEPRVTVSIKQYRPFFITGEVAEPGGYPFQPGLTLRKAVTLAGGFTGRASKSKIFLAKGGNEKNREVIELDQAVRPDDVITVEQSFF